MEKRLPLALFLSFLVLFGWTILFPPPEEPEAAVPLDQAPATSAGPEAPTTAVPAGPSATLFAEAEETVELFLGDPHVDDPGQRAGVYRAVFSNRGARLVSLHFGEYYLRVGLDPAERGDPLNWLPLIEPIATSGGELGSLLLRTSASSRELVGEELDRVLWDVEELQGSTPGVVFRYGPGTGVVFTKRITFEPGTWRLHLSLEIENQDAGPGGRREFTLTPAGCVPPELGDGFYPEPRAVAGGWEGAGGDIEVDWKGAPNASEPDTIDVPSPLAFAGLHNKYFAFFLREAEGTQGTLLGARFAPVAEDVPGEPRSLIALDVPLGLRLPEPGQTARYDYVVYAGPKDRAQLEAEFEPYTEVLNTDLSTFSSIGRGLLVVLGFFHGLTGNWGVAIILLTLCVRVALFPLNRRSQTAMARYQKKMKRVQPKIEEIKERFANDPQKLREAQARLMQEEGAFPPLGGCLPMFAQIPIFFGLFSALRTSFDLRQAPFVAWIDDLSRPDRLLRLDLELPILPDIEYLNLLPILMVVLWVLQQQGMPKPADEQAARMQKMMMFMPIVFGFFLYNYAAGLSLYMMTTSTFGIIEQKVIKKVWPIDDTELEPKKKGAGCGPFAGMMEHMAEKQKEQLKRVQAMEAERRRQQKRKGRRR